MMNYKSVCIICIIIMTYHYIMLFEVFQNKLLFTLTLVNGTRAEKLGQISFH